jgi:UDP-N-acetylglucosamine acyltransferase
VGACIGTPESGTIEDSENQHAAPAGGSGEPGPLHAPAPGRAPTSIHPSALIGEDVVLGEGVSIGPFAILEAGVVVGDRCRLAPHSVLRSGTVLGSDTTVDCFAVVGGLPQDHRFDRSIVSGVVVGSGVTIREGVTIHRATIPNQSTRIGDGCFLMANSHVAHDRVLHEKVMLTNNVMLAGNVHIGAHAVVGGGAGIHQFVRIGESAMVGGNATVTQDVPPFTTIVDRNRLSGLNTIGLRRRGFAGQDIAGLKTSFRQVYSEEGDPQAKAGLLAGSDDPDACLLSRTFLDFFESGRRQFARRREGRADRGS